MINPQEPTAEVTKEVVSDSTSRKNVESTNKPSDNVKLLLTCVYGPYGLEDNEYEVAFGMLTDAQKAHLTYGQGIHSPQTTQPNYGLHLMAANIGIPTTVVDYPSWRQFQKELTRGYTHVGISFIMANTFKAKRMAEYIRKCHPEIKILLGGYGTLLPDIDALIPNDGVCNGEGIQWLRRYFNEEIDTPIIHPLLPQFTQLKIYGIDVTKRLKSCVIVAGLGCKGGCDFCTSTLLFGLCNYIPVIPDGRAFLSFCMKAEQEIGAQRFAILDDNFLKNSSMPKELLTAMEESNKTYCFTIFASADVVKELGVDFLVRAGIEQVWIGIESQTFTFSKLKGIDIPALIKELHENGITVITSSMLFMEHHDRKNLETDIDWALSLHSEIHQFAIYTPMPGTCVFTRFSEKGYLPPEVDLRELHGMTLVASKHPHFTPDEARHIQLNTYERKYNIDGPSTLLKCRTMVQGYLKVAADIKTREQMNMVWNKETFRYEEQPNANPDKYMQLRAAELRIRTERTWPILLTCKVFAPNNNVKKMATETIQLYKKTFGNPSLFMRVVSIGVLGFATLEAAKNRLYTAFTGKSYIPSQPPMRRTLYRQGKDSRLI